MKVRQSQRLDRWTDYVLRGRSNFAPFWKSYLRSQERHILFVLGLGFDPRMCSAIRDILNQGGDGKKDCQLLVFDEGPDSPSKQHSDRVQQNREVLQQLLADRGSVREHELRMWSADGRRIGSRNAALVFRRIEDLSEYTDIIVDISALPRSIYFPLIGKLLSLLDGGQHNTSPPNLHVVVCESVDIDRLIHAEGIDDDATYLHGFSGGVDMEATAGIPRIWIPILGEDQAGELERIYDLVHPDEICPVLPFSSGDPRRGDNLILEYRQLLFDRFRVEPRNIIFASEKNPFEVYRELTKTVIQYRNSLSSLKGCKVVISALSSKLLSLGALLTAYELRTLVGIAHVEVSGYVMPIADPNMLDNVREELFEIWLAGECYAT
jgi:hypothetical protein